MRSKSNNFKLNLIFFFGFLVVLLIPSITLVAIDHSLSKQDRGGNPRASIRLWDGDHNKTYTTNWGIGTNVTIYPEQLLDLDIQSSSLKKITVLGSEYYHSAESVDIIATTTRQEADDGTFNNNDIGIVNSEGNSDSSWIKINNTIQKERWQTNANVTTSVYTITAPGRYSWSFQYRAYVYSSSNSYGDMYAPLTEGSGSLLNGILIGNNTAGLISANHASFSNGIDSLNSSSTTNDLGFTNRDIYFSFSSSVDLDKNLAGVANAKYTRTDSTGAVLDKDVNYNSGSTLTNEGNYTLTVTDNAGNVRKVIFGIDKTLTSNLSSLQKSYTIGSWWEAKLSSYFNNKAGTYSLATQQDMQDFAFAMEYEQRVSYVNGKWNYIPVNNSSGNQIYEDKDALIKAVKFYSEKLYGTRKTISYKAEPPEILNPMKKLGVVTDGGGVERYTFEASDSVLVQNDYIELPEWVISNIPALENGNYYTKIRGSYVFERKDKNQISSNVNPLATFLGEVSYAESGGSYSIQYGVRFDSSENFGTAGGYKQGYYLITENDIAGNYKYSVVYVDRSTPTLFGTVILNEIVNSDPETGEGEHLTQNISIDSSTDHVTEEMYYYFYGLQITDLVGMDEVNAVSITGGQYNNEVFLVENNKRDELPLLSNDTSGKGEYTITVFNRSGASFEFKVYIAGRLPYATYTGLNGTKDAVFTINRGESYNSINDIKIFRRQENGEKVQLATDDYGTDIDNYTMEYRFAVGGTFVISVLDSFGEWVDLPEVTFTKGLPVGELKGVEINETTRREVTFSFDDSNATLTVTKDGQLYNGYTLTPNENNNDIKSLTLAANTDGSNDGAYMIKLNRKDLPEVFNDSYKFNIRTTISPFEIYAGIYNEDTGVFEQGQQLQPNTSINKPVTVNYSKLTGIRVYYSTSSSFETRLLKGQYLQQAGDYTFRIIDGVGNQVSFNIYIKLAVQYEIVGSYTMYDGKLLTNQIIRVSPKEQLKTFTITNEYGENMDTNQSLSDDGEYSVFMEDNYENTASLTIVVMRNKPAIQLFGVEPDGITNGVVSALFGDNQTANLYKQNSSSGNYTIIGEYQPMDEIVDNGKYRLTVKDIANNETTVEFQIKTEVDVEYDIVNGSITTKAVNIKKNEPLTSTVKYNGEDIEEQSRYTESGGYEMHFVDNYGNTLDLKFSIVAKRSQYFSYVIPDFIAVDYVALGGEIYDYTIENNILNLSQSGNYTISLVNLDNNEKSKVDIEVDNIRPNIEFVGLDLESMTSKGRVTIKSVDKNEVNVYLVNGDKLERMSIGSSIDSPGKYTIRAIDDLGNECEYSFEVLYSMNAGTVIVIVLGSILVLLGALFVAKRYLKVKVR